MIKATRESRQIQKVIRALSSPAKSADVIRALTSPAKSSKKKGATKITGGGTPAARLDTMWYEAVGGTPPVGSLTMAPSPCTPADEDDAMTPTAGRQTPQHVAGITPELRAALPSHPLTQWTEAEVAACIQVLGRDMAREGTNSARDVSAFDAYAETFLAKGIDGAKFASISIPQLNHELGVSNFNHRLIIVSWIKTYLEVI